MDKKENEGTGIFWLFIIVIIVFAILILKSCAEGTVAFFSDKGALTWLVVVGGLAVFVYLVAKAKK